MTVLEDGPIVTWNRVMPVIAVGVALVTDSSPAVQHGPTARVVVTFVEEGSGGVCSAVDVVGFVNSDVGVTASALSESGLNEVLPVLVTVAPIASIAYEVLLKPDTSQWPSSMFSGCAEVTLTLDIAGALLVLFFLPITWYL